MKRLFLALMICFAMRLAGQASAHLSSASLAEQRETDAALDQLYSEAQAAKGRGDLEGAIQKYKAILKLAPHLATAYNNLGLLYFQQGNYRDAASAFEDGLRYDKNMPSSLVLLGVSYYQMGQFEKSRQILANAVRLRPEDQTAQLYLGHALFDLGQQEAGAAVLQALLHKAPENLPALYGLGQMYMKMAQGTLKKLDILAPDSYFIHLINAQTMEGMENYEGALAEYKKAVAKEPNFRDAHYDLGNIYWLMGKWDQATTEFKKEIAANPYDCMAYWKLGNILVKTHGNSGQALSLIQSALGLCPDLPQALTDYGQLLAQQAEYEKAIQQFKRAIQLSPGEDSVHFQLARAYQMMGRVAEAKAEYAIAQGIQQQHSRAVQSRIEDVEKSQ